MSKIIVNGSLIPSTKNSPLDIRTRVNTIEEVSSIQMPFVGMIFYVIDEDKFYVVKKLKDSLVGNIEIKDNAIDVFEPLIDISVDGTNIDLSKYVTKEFVEEQIAAIELKEGPAGQDGKDFTYDMFTQEQLEALRGPAGKDGAMGLQGLPGQDGKDGAPGQDGKDFTYDMFTEEQLQLLRGPVGPEGPEGKQGIQGEQGLPGVQGEPGKDFKYEDFTLDQLEMLTGPRGLPGVDGISVVAVEIDEANHLMVRLSNDQVLDAGELPAGQGGGGAVNPEVEKELAETKQQLLDLTYGVEYEWVYFCEQDEELNSIGFNRETAPKFYEEIDAAIEAGDEAFEEFIINMYEQDIYRMYVLRIVSEHKYANRYELLPLIDNPHHSRSAFLAKWNATAAVDAWNVDIENDVNGFEFIGGFPTSPLVLAFLKIKK